MLRKAFAIILISVFVFSSTRSAYCDTALKKLGRGFCNVITSPLEIPEQTQRVNNSDGPMAAVTYGFLKGIIMTGVRAVVGVYEIATFPIPFPRQYKPILKNPEFFLEDMVW
ncbi:MAG: exosortase system-associated protein, TIGR04073 family [Candidatus Omnitrophica bacterium]|nr:exosortase system-associated protein, TIGR04073 family [Candidatus Omnitrophota bacterium]MBI5144285.1 exosortase system-associated protein, TIGR04073 family [Candidatus Omnitrophota bacterium]